MVDAPHSPSESCSLRNRRSQSSVTSVSYEVYTRRWFILLVLCILNVSNAMIWISFAPIADLSATFYNASSFQINLLSLVFMVVALVFGIFSSFILDRFGLRLALNIGSTLNTAGAALRLISGLECATRYSYVLCFIGQLLASFAQPLILFAPTKIASVWFAEDQRATANMLASMANPLGILLTFVIFPKIVTDVNDLRIMLIVTLVPAAVGTLLAFVGIRSSAPPTPPSASANVEHIPFLDGIRQTMKNKAFWVLFLAFGAGMGLFSTLATLLQQILCTRGYDDDFSGLCGALMIGCGIVGAGIAGVVTDKTKKFDEVAKLSFAFACLALIAFSIVSRYPSQNTAIAITVALFGFGGFAFYPIALELGVECTYPVSEGTSTGILVMGGQLQGILMILIGQFTATNPDSNDMVLEVCSKSKTSKALAQDFTMPNMIFSGIAVLMCCILLLGFRTIYKRLRAEQGTAADSIINYGITSRDPIMS